MSKDFTIIVGTAAEGIWTSHDSGITWIRSSLELPVFHQAGEVTTRAITVNPHDPSDIWIGTTADLGYDIIQRSRDAGDTFHHVPAPPLEDQREIWSIAIDPNDPDTVYVGTRPAAVFKTSDGGRNWIELPVGAPEVCPFGLEGSPDRMSTRLTAIEFVPGSSDEIWVSVEIGGLFHTTDAGQTWEHSVLADGESLMGPTEVFRPDRHTDIHDLAMARTPEGVTFLATTPIGFFRSTDNGTTWKASRGAPLPDGDSFFYSRGVIFKHDDPNVVLYGTGDFIPGTKGVVQRSEDGGVTWSPVGPKTKSLLYRLASHPSMPEVMVATSIYGQVLVSRDGGLEWDELDRAFGETRIINVTPAGAS
ncbi:MAG: hypothetical protein M3Z03_14290 [Actinomycetota bacterium]|nr:hypothetical protein [Actinomycetota bacterium]